MSYAHANLVTLTMHALVQRTKASNWFIKITVSLLTRPQCPTIAIAVQISIFKLEVKTIFKKISLCYQLEIFQNMIGPRSLS